MKAVTTHLKRRLIVSVIGASVVAIGAAPVISWAQTANATLRGDAPANTKITAFDPTNGITRRTTSSDKGRYALVGLLPGTYEISVAGGVKHTVTLTVASTATLDLTGAAKGPGKASAEADATKLGTVNVIASTLAEVKTPEIGTTISQHMIQTLPQVSQNFLEFADIVPGVAFTVAPNGNTSLRGGAQSPSGANVYIDGVSQKDYVLGGIAGQANSQGNPFPEGAIGQYKVISSAYKAEYDQVSSVAITAQSKSGTNEFHGNVFERFTNGGFRARRPDEMYPNKKVASQEKEFGGSFGGPIIKNVAHFFVAYAGKRFITPINVAPDNQAVSGVAYLPADLQSQFGAANLPFTENMYFGKIDVEPTDRDRIELTGLVRNESQRGQVGGVNAASSAIEKKDTNRRFALRWDHSGSFWYNELIFAHQKTFNVPAPPFFGNGFAYTLRSPLVNDPTIIHTGPPDPRAYQNKGQQGNEIKDDLTFNDLQWHGNHVVKMGAVYRDLTLTAQDAGTADPQYFYHVTPPGTLVDTGQNDYGVADINGTLAVPGGISAEPYQVVFARLATNIPGVTPKVVTKDYQLGAYIQDDWDITERLQVNLGVRWDYENEEAYTHFVTPPQVIAALNSQIPAEYLDADPTGAFQKYAGEKYIDALNRDGSQHIQDYISNGHNRRPNKNQWQPRLGFSYDINNDQAHVIHGGAGRSYTHNIYNFLQLEKTKTALSELTVGLKNPADPYCYRNIKPCLDFSADLLNNPASLQALNAGGTEFDLLNNNLKTPYSDQFTLGISNSIGDWQTDATVARILFHDGFLFTIANRWPDGSFFDPNIQPTPKINPGAQPLPGYGILILGRNGRESRNTELLLSATKPFTKASGWGMTIAYTHTHAKQNRSEGGHYAFDYGNISDYPFVDADTAAKHRLVVSGSYAGPWGLVIGGKLKLATPVPVYPISCFGPNQAHTTTFSTGSHCELYTRDPEGGHFLLGGPIWGTREVDFQVTKHFNLTEGISMYARFDVLNAFNFRNFAGSIVDSSRGPGRETVRYNPTGPINFVPRTIKFEVGANF